MKQTEIIMGMPITVEIVDAVEESASDDVFTYFRRIDDRFSTYKPASEISRINRGLPKDRWSEEMTRVLELCEETKHLTKGYFDISHQGKLDPSGLVKGWAIHNAAQSLLDKGVKNFYIEAGGDIQAQGYNHEHKPWVVGIRNPMNIEEIIKVVQLTGQGMATSGTYIRGQHIYDPHDSKAALTEIQSLTVIGSDIYEADRYATAAFAMGRAGIAFIENTLGLEGYMVDSRGIATFTSGFKRYTVDHV